MEKRAQVPHEAEWMKWATYLHMVFGASCDALDIGV